MRRRKRGLTWTESGRQHILEGAPHLALFPRPMVIGFVAHLPRFAHLGPPVAAGHGAECPERQIQRREGDAVQLSQSRRGQPVVAQPLLELALAFVGGDPKGRQKPGAQYILRRCPLHDFCEPQKGQTWVSVFAGAVVWPPHCRQVMSVRAWPQPWATRVMVSAVNSKLWAWRPTAGCAAGS